MSNGKRGGQEGNDNATKGKRWADAIDRALSLRSKTDGYKDLVDLAEVMLKAAENGESWAIKELGDRLDGKPHQSATFDGDLGITVIQYRKDFDDDNDSV